MGITDWAEYRETLNLTTEDEAEIQFEKRYHPRNRENTRGTGREPEAGRRRLRTPAVRNRAA
jgi:hypothetical protein